VRPLLHTTTAQKLTRGRVQLILEQPFFGTLSLLNSRRPARKARVGKSHRHLACLAPAALEERP
jgi:hypothetical protein